MNILKKIIDNKKKEVINRIATVPVNELEKEPLFTRTAISFKDSIISKEKTGVIAEFKRRSPSLGDINGKADIGQIVSGYCRYGASAVSVLTDSNFFGGSNEDLIVARSLCTVPVLRKDFIIDEYQVLEAKAIGADAILLIAAVNDKNAVLRLARLAQSLGLQVLLEIHDSSELEMVNGFVDVIGVNNRDLNNFMVNINTSLLMAEKIPQQFVKISESGISSKETVHKLLNAGYDGFLIGEAFMKTPDPVASFSAFVNKI